MHSDPVADMLTRLRNGSGAGLSRVNVPHSRLKEGIAQVLSREGYIEGFRLVGSQGTPQRAIEVMLRYDRDRQPILAGIRRLSKPGLRRHYRAKRIPKVRNGLGIVILTTSRGLMTDEQARASQVGGEALCSVW